MSIAPPVVPSEKRSRSTTYRYPARGDSTLMRTWSPSRKVVSASTRSAIHDDFPFSLISALPDESLPSAGRKRQIVIPNCATTDVDDGQVFVAGCEASRYV